MKSRGIYKKSTVCVCLLAVICFLCGCSLAIPEAGGEEEKTQDRLIGVFITTENLDLFDMEGYLNENADQLLGGQSIQVHDTAEYSERIYAVIDKQDSKEPSDWEVSFEGVEGVCFFHATWQSEGGTSFGMLSAGDEICDITTHLSTSDMGESVDLTGTMYVLAESGARQFYMNPVYQTADGEIYLMGGNSGSLNGMEDGGSFSMSLAENTSLTINGKTQEQSNSVKVEFALSAEPEQIRFYFMDENLNIFHTTEYAPGTLPETHTISTDIACVIAETQWKDGTCTRELFEADGEESIFVETYYKVNELALGKQVTELVWE